MTRYWIDGAIAAGLVRAGLLLAGGNLWSARRMAMDSRRSEQAVARAIELAWRRQLHSPQREAMKSVLRRRELLRSSNARIEYVDYGAGTHLEEKHPDSEAGQVTRSKRLRELVRTAASSVGELHLFFQLVQQLRAQRVLELGSFVGLSAMAMAQAQRLGGGGRLITLEGAEPFAELARESLAQIAAKQAELRLGTFHETLEDAAQSLGSIELTLVDGHHKREPTLDYFQRLLPHMAEGGVMLFDDVIWNEGMREAWREIAAHPRVRTAVNMLSMGLAIVGDPGPDGKARHTAFVV